MEGQSELSELSIISWVSAIEGCSLSGVPLYIPSLVKDYLKLMSYPDYRLYSNITQANKIISFLFALN